MLPVPGLSGIGARPRTCPALEPKSDVGILPPRLDFYTEVGIPTSLARKTHHRASAKCPGAMLSSQHCSRVFFSPFTRPAVNPGVGTGCSTQSVATGLLQPIG